VSPWIAVMALAALAGEGHESNAGTLPVCSNRTINEVVKRSGCTVGDSACWMRNGGFCTDYVEKRTGAGRSTKAKLVAVHPAQVEKGDVAAFSSRAHYAYVERVVKDPNGVAVAVDLSEFNYGTCWVDKDVMVTDQYKVVHRRAAVAVREVDGGFFRAEPAAH
jgi:hypothetical protein